jgi:hypothetical protein
LFWINVETVVASGSERLRKSSEQTCPFMIHFRRLTVARFGKGQQPSSKVLSDALMAQANPEDR